MTSQNNRAPILCYVKLCASFESDRWVQTEVTVGNSQFGSKFVIFVPCDREIWQMTLTNNWAPLLCYFKLCVSFHSHWWIRTWITARKPPIRVKTCDFFVLCELGIWWMTLKNNRALLLCYFKLCVSFLSPWSIQTGVAVRKRQIRVKIDDFFCPVRPWNLTDELEKQ